MNYLRVLAIALVATIAAMSQPASDEIAIRKIIQEEITAWNAGDAVAYSRHFASDGTFTNVRGQFFTGRQRSLTGMTMSSRRSFTDARSSRILFL
jgi:uncharacterized protein (TIGR02246 family)